MTLPLSPEDQALVDCLHKLAEEYETDETTTSDQRLSLGLLIDTYLASEDDGEFAKTLADALSNGVSIDDLREGLALDAGIIDLAQLKFFATIDVPPTRNS